MSAALRAVKAAEKVDVMANAVMAVAMVAVMGAVANAAKGPTARSAHHARGAAEVKVARRAARRAEMKAATNCVKAKLAPRVASALSVLRVSVRHAMHAETVVLKVVLKVVVRAATKAVAMPRPSWVTRAPRPDQNVPPVAKAAANGVSAAAKAAANGASAVSARNGVARAASTS